MWKKRLQILLWCVLGCACVVLLVAAIEVKGRKTCSDIRIDIDDTGDKIYINEKDVAQVLADNNVVKGAEAENIHLGLIEKELKKNAWIKDAQLFFDNNQALTVKIEERQPVARIFTTQGSSFYIDTAGNRLPLSDKFSARVPVFTSFPQGKNAVMDSTLLQDVKHIAQYIQRDSFWAAQVAQVDITAGRNYEMIPVLGNQVIILGDAQNLEGKFNRLFSFYKQVWSKTGFEKYSVINVQYEGQVVAVKRGMAAPAYDSAMAMQQYASGVVNMGTVVKDTSYANVEKREEELAKDSIAAANKRAAATQPKHDAKSNSGGKKSNGAKPPKKGNGKKTTKPLPKRV